MTLSIARKTLREYGDPLRASHVRTYFKNSQKDIFLGVKAAFVRKVAKDFWELSLSDIRHLMASDIHDERALAHQILCLKFKKGDMSEQKQIYEFYIENRIYIRDWDGVDDTAPYIVGPYLLNRDKAYLYELALSSHIWDRRIAIVSTWWFIRNNHVHDTLEIAKRLLSDHEDLIHKASGWMLREVGKRDLTALKEFLNAHASTMPRTMLRYAIERLEPAERQHYLSRKKS